MTTVEFTSDVARNTKFREKMRGYHPEEVHAFVDRAAVALEQLQAQLAEATERAVKAEAALASNAENDGMIRRTLTLAEKTAELAVSEANDDSERIRTQARVEVDRLKTESDDECRQRIAEAEETRQAARAEAATLLEAASHEAEQLRRAAEVAIAARAEAAHVELEEVLTDLAAQRTTLQGHVDALAAYLADERARVLTALNDAVESLAKTLAPAVPLEAVLSAMAATAPDGSAEPATTTRAALDPADDALEPEDEPSSVGSPSPAAAAEAGVADPQAAVGDRGDGADIGEVGDVVDICDDAVDETVEAIQPPSTLLFTFDTDRRRPDGDRRHPDGDRPAGVAVEAKPRRSARGRRTT